ncbi:MAG TPA: GNAT family N-acetyltransferase [Rhodopila sp.]|nr:GNAT family N-acetyltransferase [Rhodopila sp.]
MPTPTLTTDRLVLRAFRNSDWDDYADLMADMEVQRFLAGRAFSREESWTSMATFLGSWELRGHGMFAVEHAGRFVGRVGIYHPPDWPEPELGWTIAQAEWGHGFATEAAAAVRTWAFTTRGWTRLVSFIAKENTRSQRVAEKLGAVRDRPITLRDQTVEQWVHPTARQGVVA